MQRKGQGAAEREDDRVSSVKLTPLDSGRDSDLLSYP